MTYLSLRIPLFFNWGTWEKFSEKTKRETIEKEPEDLEKVVGGCTVVGSLWWERIVEKVLFIFM